MPPAMVGVPPENGERKGPPCLSLCKELVSIAPKLIGREGNGLVHYCWRRKAIIEEVFTPHQLELMENRQACCIYLGEDIYTSE